MIHQLRETLLKTVHKPKCFQLFHRSRNADIAAIVETNADLSLAVYVTVATSLFGASPQD